MVTLKLYCTFKVNGHGAKVQGHGEVSIYE